MNDAERMITVAELLRREGFKQSAASRKRQKMAVAATGLVALAGATVTGMLVLAPKLSTSYSTEDGQLPVPSGNGGSGTTPSTNDAREAGPPSATFADVTTMAAVREAADAPEPPVRIPAMSQIDRGAPAGVRARDNGRSSAASENSAESEPAKAPPRDDERRRSSSAESTQSRDAQQPAEQETEQPADEEARQSESEQSPKQQEREKHTGGESKGPGSGKGSEKGSDKDSGEGNGKGR